MKARVWPAATTIAASRIFAGKTELTDGRCLAVTEDNKLFDLRKPGQDRTDKFDELIIDEQCRRACMIDRVGDLLRRQVDVVPQRLASVP